MASAEDAATVLEQFCHDVSNLPAEIAHLLEEIQAKDEQILKCRDVITACDNSLQRWTRANGSHAKNPKEDASTKTISSNFDRVEILQAEKLGLSERAMIILERQIKRFDVKLRDLQSTDQFPVDPTLPSLLQPSSGNSAAPLSGISTPLNPLSVNTAVGGGGPNIANSAIARIGASTSSRTHSPMAAQNPILNQPHLSGSAARPPREASVDTAKRRRLNSSLSGNIPTQSSSLRQTSIGPSSGTPKPGTPGPSSRAGSAGPTRPPAAKKAPLSSTNKKLAPHQAVAAAASRKRARTSLLAASSSKKGDRRRQLARERGSGGSGTGRGSPSASPTPSDSRGSTSPTPSTLAHGHDGTVEVRGASRHHRGRVGGSGTAPVSVAAGSDEEGGADSGDVDAEGEEDDTQVYCTCQRVSFGDMVACDNDDCQYQWFHWGCVGLKEEPKGEWLCPYCRLLPSAQIVKAK